MSNLLKALLLTAMLLAGGPIAAQNVVYKWIDERGTTQYTQTPPVGRSYEQLGASGAPAPAASTGADADASRAASSGAAGIAAERGGNAGHGVGVGGPARPRPGAAPPIPKPLPPATPGGPNPTPPPGRPAPPAPPPAQPPAPEPPPPQSPPPPPPAPPEPPPAPPPPPPPPPEPPPEPPPPPAQPPEAPPPPGVPYPHEPEGQAWSSTRDYLARDEAGWVDRSAMSIAADPSSVHGGSIGRRLYRQGASGGSGVAGDLRFPGEHQRIYMSFRVRLSDEWRNHQGGINKFVYLYSGGAPKVILSAYGQGVSPRPAFLLRYAPGNTAYIGPHSDTSHPDGGRMTRGRWHEIELLVQTSSAPGVADGSAAWWMDGHLLRSVGGLDTHFAGEALRWQRMEWNSIWGGIGDMHEVDMWMDMDHFHVSLGAPEATP